MVNLKAKSKEEFEKYENQRKENLLDKSILNKSVLNKSKLFNKNDLYATDKMNIFTMKKLNKVSKK